MYTYIMRQLGLHTRLEIIYVVDGYEASIKTDRELTIASGIGNTIEAALNSLDQDSSILQEINTMTITEIQEAIAEIERVKNDPEHAASLERQLFIKVLEFFSSIRVQIFDGKYAYEALKVLKIDFPRWRA